MPRATSSIAASSPATRAAEAGARERLADRERVQAEQRFGRGVLAAQHALAVDHEHGGAQVGEDLRLHLLQALQALIARGERGDHALELAAEPADLVVGVRAEPAREVAARDRFDALLQARQRRQHALRPDRDADADEQREHDQRREHAERVLLLGGGARAGLLDAADHRRPHRAQAAVDRALARAQIGEDALGTLLVAGVERGVQVVVARLALHQHAAHALELAPRHRQARAVGVGRRQVLDAGDAVERARDRGGPRLARGSSARCASRSRRARSARGQAGWRTPTAWRALR